MKANKVIERVDAIRINPYGDEQKLEWINNLEEMVQSLVIQSKEIKSLSYPEDMDKELLITAPFDNLYGLYLEAMIDYYNREYANYNNSVLMFETRFTEYKKAYIRGDIVQASGGTSGGSSGGSSGGQAGKDGYTPIKGVDYFTEADKAELIQKIRNELPTLDNTELNNIKSSLDNRYTKSETYSKNEINNMLESYITDIDTLVGGDE